MMKKFLLPLLLVFAAGCDEPPVKYETPYQLTVEEVAYMVGCLEMGERLHVDKAASTCADMDEQFIKRHRRPGQEQ